MSDEQGRKISKYQLTGVAGKGGMGIVYEAYDPFIARKVAIKVNTYQTELSGDTTSANQARKMFFNEAKAAGALDHPNLLRIYEAGESEGEAYLVMELVEGGVTLKDYCDPDNLLPMEIALLYSVKCAEALAYVHEHGVTHRDVKPANILLTPDGVIKIGDFGIALRTKADQTRLTGGCMGSPKYMSPEQLRDEDVTHQTDIFSLGIVMYELFTGVQPFEASSIPAIINNILIEDPQPVNKLRPDLPDSLAWVIQRTLEKYPEERYQTGMELAADLLKVLDGLSNPIVELSDNEKFHALRQLALFDELSDSEITELIEVAEWEYHPVGYRAVIQDEEDHALYVIVSGAAVVKKDAKEIGALSSGECFGEMGYLARTKRTATVTVTQEITLMKISQAANEWASLPCQLHLNKLLQTVLMNRLADTSDKLAACL